MRIIMNRTRGSEELFAPVVLEGVTVWQALHILLCCEVLWGGKLVVNKPTKVQTVTKVMACVDQTIFEGTETEMEPLTKIGVGMINGWTTAKMLSVALHEPLALCEWALGRVGVGNPREAVGDMLAAKELAEEAGLVAFEDVLLD